MERTKPNILILMPDQMRADCVGAAGNDAIATPNIDRLAREGVLFTQCCTSSPLCMPARASFISGQYPHSHHIWRNEGRLPADYQSLFSRLREAGYRTAHIGKSHYYPHQGQHLRDEEPYMHARGFDDVHETTGPWATVGTRSYMTDRWQELGLLEAFRADYGRRREARRKGEVAVWPSPLPEEEFLDSYIGRVAVEYLSGLDSDQPFCVFVGFGGPHEPWDAPGSYATMYRPEDMPAAIEPGRAGEWVPEHVAGAMNATGHVGLTEEAIARLRANYYGKISLIDMWIGRILEVIDRRGWADNTLVMLWSDHGEMLGDHGRLYKSVFYESALRVPLIMRWPGKAEGGRVCDGLVSTVDLAPTILEAAGAEDEGDWQGMSVWRILDGEDEGRQVVFSEIGDGPLGNVMVRTRRWKYVVDRDGRGVMLFDLHEDPQERENLLGHPDFAHIEREMRDRLLAFLTGCQVMM